MAKHHGGTGFHAHIMSGFHHLKPGTGHTFIGRHLLADFIAEDFSTSAGYGIKPCLPETGYNRFNGQG